MIRNRSRRRIRALVDETADRLVPGSMIVIIARYTCPKADYSDLRRDWERLGVKAGILTTPLAA